MKGRYSPICIKSSGFLLGDKRTWDYVADCAVGCEVEVFLNVVVR